MGETPVTSTNGLSSARQGNSGAGAASSQHPLYGEALSLNMPPPPGTPDLRPASSSTSLRSPLPHRDAEPSPGSQPHNAGPFWLVTHCTDNHPHAAGAAAAPSSFCTHSLASLSDRAERHQQVGWGAAAAFPERTAALVLEAGQQGWYPSQLRGFKPWMIRPTSLFFLSSA